jgi:tRNA pseudouridine38-40 synthase
VRLVVSYDGTAYAGWQAQAEPPTVQAILTREARRLCGADARVTGASRTDAGVHALRQTVSLTIASALPPAAILGALNAALPPDIRVREAGEALPTFHARYGAQGKRYAYLIDNGRIASPLLRRFAWHVAAPLDVGRMRLGLRALSGTHDFSAFRAAAGREQTPVCTVRAAHVFRRGERVAILISADRYLHHMVRNVVGSVVDVGRGTRTPEWVADVLASRDRQRAGPTAPAHGLTLVRVMY